MLREPIISKPKPKKPLKEKLKKATTPKSFSVTSGKFKGQKLTSTNLPGIHPMGSRERLGLFNSLGPDLLKNATVLDVFAGTGAVGFEALSRGAFHVTFVDKNQTAINTIRTNIGNLKLSKNTFIMKSKAENLTFTDQFDLVFADPPYDLISRVSISTLNHLASLARHRFILSHPANFDPHSIKAKLISTKNYANARISIFIPEMAES